MAAPGGVRPDRRIEPAVDSRRVAAAVEGMQSGPVSKEHLVLRGESRAVSVMPRFSHPHTLWATSHRIGGDKQPMVFWGTGGLGGPNTRDTAFSLPEGRLFFAGSETVTGWQRRVDGAVESGLRAARQVCRTLAPAS
ncbi:FAD-dependent oxidoreductase [Streptomyces sp. NPDC057236]|uniref:FAD-dependent oxidoreductase n=1 Tax=Streptomyces sp. NPDC057236 TaxID=3346059 RepID=UPI00362597A0